MEKSFREEAFSFFTHLGGALLALAGLVLLVLRARGPLALTAFAIYGVTLVAMFAASTFHHVRHSERGLARRLDMSAIYLFIAGTYTPPALLALPPLWGLPIVTAAWAFALIGVALLIWRPDTSRKVTVGLYLGLGWMAVVAFYPIATLFPWEAIALLVAGGLTYTVGAVVYASKWPDPWPRIVGYHGLWHVFVLVGAALHFALIWLFVPVG